MLRWIFLPLQTMDKHERDNWVKVKEALEKANKTDCYFYKRAVAIIAGKPDPLQ